MAQAVTRVAGGNVGSRDPRLCVKKSLASFQPGCPAWRVPLVKLLRDLACGGEEPYPGEEGAAHRGGECLKVKLTSHAVTLASVSLCRPPFTHL